VRWAATAQTSPAERLGTVFPLLTSTFGQVFSAYLDRSKTRTMIEAELAQPDGSAARAGIRTMAQVDTMLAAVRARGLTAANSLVAPGICAISAPVFGHTNGIVAAIAVVGLQGQIDISLDGPAAKALLSTSESLSRRLGAREGAVRFGAV
jgi:DNA-binding IclR family transcriptional regulator